MINQTHIVIDLETMGCGTNAAIVAIGAVRINNGEFAGELYQRINLATSLAAGATTDAGTISWWLRQSDAARTEINDDKSSMRLEGALHELRRWISSDLIGSPRLWGNGATFDLRILGEAYDLIGEPRPWDYPLERDLRTILDLYPAAKDVGQFEGTRHHALHDARHEAKQLCKALRLHAGKAIEQPDMQTMVSRFLAWPLPASVQSDPCALDPAYPHRHGTNLLTADEAVAMLEHVLVGGTDHE